MTLICMKMSSACRTHFHMKGFALRLVLKQRHKRTRKWPIRDSSHFSHPSNANAIWNVNLVQITNHIRTTLLAFEHMGKEFLFSSRYMSWKLIITGEAGFARSFEPLVASYGMSALFVITRSQWCPGNQNLTSPCVFIVFFNQWTSLRLLLFPFHSWLKLDPSLTTSMLTLWQEICG